MFTGLQNTMRFKPTNCKHLQGAADARSRVRRRTFLLQVPDNKADAVPCERLRIGHWRSALADHCGPRFEDLCGRRSSSISYSPNIL